MNLMLWSTELTDKMMPVLESLRNLGFDGVEVPIFDYNLDKWKIWRKKLDDIGLERTAVTVLNEENNPISADKKIRLRSLENVKMSLECCQELDAKILVGPLHSALGVFSGKGATNDEWRWGVETVKNMSEYAAKSNISLGIEFLNRFENYFLTCAEDTVKFVKEIDHPNCGILYDTFHAHIEEKDHSKAIRGCSEYIISVHISENDRSTPGKGNMNWNAVFDGLKEIGYDSWFIIEAFGQSLDELSAATKIWRRMYENEEQLARDGLKFIKQEVAKRW